MANESAWLLFPLEIEILSLTQNLLAMKALVSGILPSWDPSLQNSLWLGSPPTTNLSKLPTLQHPTAWLLGVWPLVISIQLYCWKLGNLA